MKKMAALLSIAALVSLAGCGPMKNISEPIKKEAVEASAVQSKWLLKSYRINNQSTNFGDKEKYRLVFDDENRFFSISTDCNRINGSFVIKNGRILFQNMLVTQMACTKETVEQNLLRLLNNSKAYGLRSGSKITLNSPSVGSAAFVLEDAVLPKKDEAASEDKKLVQESLLGKTFSGYGKGGGLATSLSLSFKDNHRLECISDFYQAFPKPTKTSGYYNVENGVVTVECHPTKFEKPIVWDFTVSNNGEELSFNRTDSSVPGSISQDWMNLRKK